MAQQFNKMGFNTDSNEVLDEMRILNKIMDADSRRIYGKIDITYTDPFLDESITAVAGNTAMHTHPIQTADNNTETPYKWFSLTNNKLDGTFHPLPDESSKTSVGWWSGTLCNLDGTFTHPVPIITIAFDARAMYSLRVVGDSKLNEFPVNFHISLEDFAGQEIYSEEVLNNNSVSWSKQLEVPVLNVCAITLTIFKINATYRTNAKIVEFYTAVQETYETDDIISINLLEEQMFEDQTLPIGNVSSNEIDVRLYNQNGRFNAENRASPLYGLLKKNRRLKAWLGTEVKGALTWYPLGTFWTTQWDAPRSGLYADFSARDRMEILRSTDFETSLLYVNKSVSWLAELILNDAGLVAEEYALDEALDSIIIPYAWFDRISHRDALVKLATVALARTYCDREGRIVMQIFEPAEKSVYSYSDDRSLFNTTFPLPRTGIVNSVSVQANYRMLVPESEVYSLTTPFTVPYGSTVTERIVFNNIPVTDIQAPVVTSGAGLTVVEYKAYAWGMDITFANDTPTDIYVQQLTVRGKVLELTSPRIVTVEDAVSIRDEGRNKYELLDNDFIQTADLAKDIADLILSTYKDPRHDAVLETRGHIALTLGHRVSVPAYDNGSFDDYTLVRQSLSWDGTLSSVVEAQKIGSDN